MTELVIRHSARPEAVQLAILEDLRLGLDTRVVALSLAARASGPVCIPSLCEKLGVGRDRWRRIARELEDTGRLRRRRMRSTTGTMGWHFEFDPVGGLA